MTLADTEGPPAGSRDVHVANFFANGSWGWTCRRPLHHLGISRLGPNRDKQVQLWRRLIRRLAYWLHYKEKSRSNTLLEKKVVFLIYVFRCSSDNCRSSTTSQGDETPWFMKRQSYRIRKGPLYIKLRYSKLHVQSCSYHLSVFESFGTVEPTPQNVILRQRSRAVRASSERGSLQQQIPQLRTGNKLMEHNSVANVKLNATSNVFVEILRCLMSVLDVFLPSMHKMWFFHA